MMFFTGTVEEDAPPSPAPLGSPQYWGDGGEGASEEPLEHYDGAEVSRMVADARARGRGNVTLRHAVEWSAEDRSCLWCGGEIPAHMAHYRVESPDGIYFHHCFPCRRARRERIPVDRGELIDNLNTAIAALVCLCGAAGIAFLTCILLGWRP